MTGKTSSRDTDRQFIKAVLDETSRVSDPAFSGLISYMVGGLWSRGVTPETIAAIFDEELFEDYAQKYRAAQIMQKQYARIYKSRVRIALKDD